LTHGIVIVTNIVLLADVYRRL